MGCRMAQEIIFGLFPFSRDILKWGGGGGGGGGGVVASRALTSVPKNLGRSGWHQIYGLFMGSSYMQAMTTSKLLLKSYQSFEKSKKSI